MDAIPLTAGEHADFFLLIGAGEVEPRNVRPRVHLAAAHFERVVAAGDFLVDRVVGLEVVADLIDVAQLTVGPILSSPSSGSSWPMSMRSSVVLPAPFGPMMPTMPPAGRRKFTFSKITRSPYDLLEVLALDDHVAQPRPGRNLNFQFLRPVFELLGRHLFVGLDASLALGLPGLGRRLHPFQFAGQRLLPGGGLLLFDLQPRCFCSSHEE